MIIGRVLAVILGSFIGGVTAQGGGAHADAVEEFAEDLRNPLRRAAARGRLMQAGVLAVPVVLDMIESEMSSCPASSLVPFGVQMLNDLGSVASDAIPTLLRILSSRDVDLSESAIKALGSVGPYRREDVPLIVDMITERAFTETDEGPRESEEASSRIRLRYSMVMAIARLRVDPYSSSEELVTVLLNDNNPASRAFAAEILVHFAIALL